MNTTNIVCSLLVLGLFFFVTEGLAQGLSVGDKALDFSLKNVNNKTVSLEDYSKEEGLIIVFTCNHCPYSVLYEDRIIELQNKFGEDGFPVIAINPNDPEQYPSDSFKNMKKRAKKKGFNFPYLLDDTQEIARGYGALRTPHVYVLSNKDGRFAVEYIGAIDDSAKSEDKVEVRYVEDAIKALKEGEAIEKKKTKAVGCSIKWKKS